MTENKLIMAKNILYYMNKRNVSASDVCKACGFKQNTFSDWVNAKIYPRIDKIEIMANYFGVSKSDLVEDIPISEKERAEKIIQDYIDNGSDPKHTDTVEIISEEDKLLLARLHRVRQSTLDSINLLIQADLHDS